MPVTYRRSSPYFNTSVKNDKYLDILNYRKIPANRGDIEYEITDTYKHRPDLLAFDLYQDVNLWWVFVVRNPNTLRDPVFDFTTGTVIYIPTKETVNSALGI
jgi:hypothetical protein